MTQRLRIVDNSGFDKTERSGGGDAVYAPPPDPTKAIVLPASRTGRDTDSPPPDRRTQRSGRLVLGDERASKSVNNGMFPGRFFVPLLSDLVSILSV